MSAEYTKPRPEWVKFNFRDLTTSLKWKRMTLAQRGAYITLLAEQALNDCLPTEAEDLACVIACTGSNITEAEALEAWGPPLEECFTEREGGLGNPRMDRELGDYDALVSSKRQKKVEAGKKGASKRWQKDGKNMAPDSTAIANDALDVEGDRDLEETKSKEEEEGAKAPAPLEPKKRTRQNRAKNLEQALKDSDAPKHLHQPLADYCEARKGGRLGVWSVARWEKEIAKLAALDPEDAALRCEAACNKPWACVVYSDQTPMNAQQAGSQAPSRGSYCKAAPLHKVERNGMLSDIHMHYKQQTQNWELSRDEATRMARAENHPIQWELDWREGMRNDPPPLNGTPPPTILEITNEPPH